MSSYGYPDPGNVQPTGEADVAVVPVTVSVGPSFVTNVRLWWWVSVMREAVREQGLLVVGGASVPSS